ncbi:phage baseplate assembly protein V [Moraxella sp. Pampa]|uniref:phage baseplate assembly protein V n=1 Tax=Moraxella sp. Pampa TaxID=3111978 RepID=UPI002B415CF8|nr:phage baseplate assembly protein V [Moraxella sp. Pampa]
MSHDIIRRLENLIRIGTVASVDHATARCTVDCAGIVTAPLPWLTLRAGTDRTWDAPTVGEQVLVLAAGGEMMQAVVLMGLYHEGCVAPSDQPNIKTRHFEDDCTISYDTKAHALSAILPDGGSVVITAKAGVTINAKAGVTINAKGGATINGDTQINGTLKATGDVVAGSISLQNHKHREQGDRALTSGAM